METTQILENPVCETGMHLQTEGGKTPLKLGVNICICCFKDISYKNFGTKYCESCAKEVARKQSSEWKKNHPEKTNDYRIKWLKKCKRNNFYHPLKKKHQSLTKSPSLLICVICGESFTHHSPHTKTCSIECRRLHRNQRCVERRKNNPICKKKYLLKLENYNKRIRSDYQFRESENKRTRECHWEKKEQMGIIFEKRYYINNCIICNRDISMLHPVAKYCDNCKEKHLHELGTIDVSSHMRRRYNHIVHKVVPDFDIERKAIDTIFKNLLIK